MKFSGSCLSQLFIPRSEYQLRQLLYECCDDLQKNIVDIENSILCIHTGYFTVSHLRTLLQNTSNDSSGRSNVIVRSNYNNIYTLRPSHKQAKFIYLYEVMMEEKTFLMLASIRTINLKIFRTTIQNNKTQTINNKCMFFFVPLELLPQEWAWW